MSMCNIEFDFIAIISLDMNLVNVFQFVIMLKVIIGAQVFACINWMFQNAIGNSYDFVISLMNWIMFFQTQFCSVFRYVAPWDMNFSSISLQFLANYLYLLPIMSDPFHTKSDCVSNAAKETICILIFYLFR